MLVTKKRRDAYLRKFNRFYQCGWLDAERGDKPQLDRKDVSTKFGHDYVDGYHSSMSNQFAISGAI